MFYRSDFNTAAVDKNYLFPDNKQLFWLSLKWYNKYHLIDDHPAAAGSKKAAPVFRQTTMVVEKTKCPPHVSTGAFTFKGVNDSRSPLTPDRFRDHLSSLARHASRASLFQIRQKDSIEQQLIVRRHRGPEDRAEAHQHHLPLAFLQPKHYGFVGEEFFAFQESAHQ